jgi:hypothetical protein
MIKHSASQQRQQFKYVGSIIREFDVQNIFWKTSPFKNMPYNSGHGGSVPLHRSSVLSSLASTYVFFEECPHIYFLWIASAGIFLLMVVDNLYACAVVGLTEEGAVRYQCRILATQEMCIS